MLDGIQNRLKDLKKEGGEAPVEKMITKMLPQLPYSGRNEEGEALLPAEEKRSSRAASKAKILELLNSSIAAMEDFHSQNPGDKYLDKLIIFFEYLIKFEFQPKTQAIRADDVALILINGLNRYVELNSNYNELNGKILAYTSAIHDILPPEKQKLADRLSKESQSKSFYKNLESEKAYTTDEKVEALCDLLKNIHPKTEFENQWKKINEIRNKERDAKGGEQDIVGMLNLPNSSETAVAKFAFSDFVDSIKNSEERQKNPDYSFLIGILKDCNSLISDHEPKNLDTLKDNYTEKNFFKRLFARLSAIPFVRNIFGFPPIAVKYMFLNFVNITSKAITTAEHHYVSFNELKSSQSTNKLLAEEKLKLADQNGPSPRKNNSSTFLKRYSSSSDFQGVSRRASNLLIKIIQGVKSSLLTKKN